MTLVCGSDVSQSRTLQISVITAASIATRCFPGAVRILLDDALFNSSEPLPPLTRDSFANTLAEIVGPQSLASLDNSKVEGQVLVFGNAEPPRGALRITFDGWIAQVGPATSADRLPERTGCSLSGVLAGALSVSELFQAFAALNVEAMRRIVGLSLWRPDLRHEDPEAQGPPLQFLPEKLWLLGLGHLGNAYIWTLASLPYERTDTCEIYLNDFDRVETKNVDTGLLFRLGDEGSFKTRVCAAWLEARKFRTRLIERPLRSDFRRHSGHEPEPPLAFCGFDWNPARRLLSDAGFSRVMDSGLGGTMHNFETINFHSLPNRRTAEELWPDASEEESAELERIADEHPVYSQLAKDPCGRAELAGKSVAVPFVGVAAATMVVAETLRLLHGGPAYTDIKLSLTNPANRSAIRKGDYAPADAAGISYCRAHPN